MAATNEMGSDTPMPGVPDDSVQEALVTLRADKRNASQQLTSQAVDSLVTQVQQQTGLSGEVAGVLGSLRSFRVRASEHFLKALAESPTVAKVQACGAHGSAKIEPVTRHQIDLPD